ncbi:glycosyltransferase family 4 protein [Psychrobacillus sp.]|uniref:glycosyltransferase family 4 protein n=1 Tax=Psychrobacillus sp. TaxID=1871623 RepID=UPI0028BDA31E|nr:glycosyltransferase family 4 protein [Psychrobacillus sp.]
MSKIWVVSQFTDKFSTDTSNRYSYIFNQLKNDYQNDVRFVTSSFSHVTKSTKNIENQDITLIDEPGYHKNASVRRVFSHFLYALRSYKYLKKNVDKGDILIVAIPSNTLAMLLAILKKRKNFTYIVDIHDTWPESLFPILNTLIRFLSLPFFFLWREMRHIAVRNCDLLLAESRQYKDDHKGFLNPGIKSHSILLGADITNLRSILPMNEKDDKKIRLVFAGTLGVNYDLDTIIRMIKSYDSSFRESNLEFVFFGNGEKEFMIKEAALEYPDLITHLNRTSYLEYISVLKSFDIGINSFQRNTNVKYSYKSVDYLISGLPVLNSLEGEFSEDVLQNDIGVDYIASDIDSLFSAIKQITINLREDRNWYKKNIENYINETLDRAKIYNPLFEFVQNVSSDSRKPL